MKKESQKCDSLKLRYFEQFKTLQDLAKSNLEYFSKMQNLQDKNKSLQIELDKSVKALRRRKNNWLLPTSLGVIGGLVGGFVLSN